VKTNKGPDEASAEGGEVAKETRDEEKTGEKA
jgi:hypothetical protein